MGNNELQQACLGMPGAGAGPEHYLRWFQTYFPESPAIGLITESIEILRHLEATGGNSAI